MTLSWRALSRWVNVVAVLAIIGLPLYWLGAWAPHVAYAKNPYRIIIDVPTRSLTLYRDNKPWIRYPVAVGTRMNRTPRGEFEIVQKAVWGDGFGTRWMRFSAPWGIYGIHGTDKPWTVGTVASHGCIRMLNRDVEQLYSIVPLGTPVDLIGPTPYARMIRPLTPGVMGQDVVELQRLLRLGHFYGGALNGVYTPEVDAAVKKFQRDHHLAADGVASLAVIHALQQATGQAGRKPRYLDLKQIVPLT